MNSQQGWERALQRFHLVGAEYQVIRPGIEPDGIVCPIESMRVIGRTVNEGGEKIHILFLDVGWTDSPRFQHLFSAIRIEAREDPPRLEMEREDGVTLVFTPLSSKTKDLWVNWRETKKRNKDVFERLEAEVLADWMNAVKEGRV